MSLPAYAIITPARNEGAHLLNTINAVVSQTVRPRKWIIVDDGSTDNTGRIIDDAAQQHSWIKAVHRPDRGYRKAGSGLVETFYEGFALIREEPWDFVCNLDGDISFEPSYFEQCLKRFSSDPKLGIGGGTVCIAVKGGLVEESKGDPKFHVRGAAKIYRRGCWDAIGGLVRAPGWDTVDECKANMLGWTTYTFSDIRLVHHRPTGNAYGAWKTSFKYGRAGYLTGYHPLFMLGKCLKRLRNRPYCLVSVGLLAGFLGGYFARLPRSSDPDLIRYIRKQQIRRILNQDSIWV
jgi:glycosyltransferase involved in cell wall biosynthesis